MTTGPNVFAPQGSLIFYPLAWLTHYVPTVPLLLTVQSAALALAVVPLWRVCRRLASLRTGASLMVLLVYSLHPAIQSLNLDGFHPETLAVPVPDRGRLLRAVASTGVGSRSAACSPCCAGPTWAWRWPGSAG